jgi:type I restriction enzyme M protein
LELCVRLLRPGGRLGIVLPEGMFGNKGEGYVWQWLSTQGRILALLDCPRTTFQPSTDTKTNALFFERAKRVAVVAPTVPTVVRVGVALTCGHDRRGRSQLAEGSMHPDDFIDLGKSYHAKDGPKTLWRDVKLARLDYLVPRYYAERQPITAQEKDLTRGATWSSLTDLVAAKLLTIRKGHEVGSDAYGTGDVPFVRTSDISNFEISADPTKAVSADIYTKFSKQQHVKAGDVLIVVDGRYRIGATAMLTKHNSKCVVQSHFRIIGTPEPQQLDPYEVLFALNLPSVRLRIRDLVFIQSTLGTLGKRLYELKIPILHGDGPWRSHVDTFRRLLQERDLLLGELATRAGPDFEL